MPKNSYRTAVRPWLNSAISSFIDRHLVVHGQINRKDIMAGFGVSIVTASRYLNSYREMKPEAMVYDHGSKTYKAKSVLIQMQTLRSEDIIDEILTVGTWLEQEHEREMRSLGRNPEDYSSEYSLTADKLRNCMRRAKRGDG